MVDILTLIPFGHENPVSRDSLARIYMEVYGIDEWKDADRKARKDIEKSIKNGALIANVGSGYFQFKDASDIPYFESYFRSEDKKGWSTINKNRPQKKFIRAFKNRCTEETSFSAIYDQIDMFDYLNQKNDNETVVIEHL